jgi:hypothetical protein
MVQFCKLVKNLYSFLFFFFKYIWNINESKELKFQRQGISSKDNLTFYDLGIKLIVALEKLDNIFFVLIILIVLVLIDMENELNNIELHMLRTLKMLSYNATSIINKFLLITIKFSQICRLWNHWLVHFFFGSFLYLIIFLFNFFLFFLFGD